MCGIVGFSAYKGKRSSYNHLSILMLANMKRGIHATGIYYGENTIKSSDIADIFLSKNKIKESKIFIGHVRQASIGSKDKDDNAHPFEHEHAIGVHNGTLTYWIGQANDLKIDHSKIIVDSDFLIKALSDDRALGHPRYKVLEDLKGAASLIWTDKSDLNKLYVYRDGERPLFSGTTKAGIYFSSTEESLALINAENIKTLPIKQVLVYERGILNEEESRLIQTKAIVPATNYYGQDYQDYGNYYEGSRFDRQESKLPKSKFNNQTNINFADKGKTVLDYVIIEDVPDEPILLTGELVKIEVNSTDQYKPTKGKLTYKGPNTEAYRYDFKITKNLARLEEVIEKSCAILIKDAELYTEESQEALYYESGSLFYIKNTFIMNGEAYAEGVNLHDLDLSDIKLSLLRGIPDDSLPPLLNKYGLSIKYLFDQLGLDSFVDAEEEDTDVISFSKVTINSQENLVTQACVDTSTSLSNILIANSDIENLIGDFEDTVYEKSNDYRKETLELLTKLNMETAESIKNINAISDKASLFFKELERGIK